MTEIIFVFRSRNESMAFCDILTRMSVKNTIINTPRECGAGCGISVKLGAADYERAMRIMAGFAYKSTFVGVFSYQKAGVRTIVRKL